jgi:desulfoferrodoxin-like iron-binding protein
MLEGYSLKCAICGKQIEIVKDGQGKLSCCNQRMFVMSSNPTSEQELQELKKTRSLTNRVRARFDRGYNQRRKDLLKLRKLPVSRRKEMAEKIKAKEKKSPGFLKSIAKAPNLKGEKTMAAQARRSASQKFGGYARTQAWREKERLSRIAAAKEQKQKKKALEKSLEAQKAKQQAAHNKLLQKRLEKVRAYHQKDIEKKKAARAEKLEKMQAAKKAGSEAGTKANKKSNITPMSKYKSKEDKNFSGNAWMSMESYNLEQELNALIAENEKNKEKPKKESFGDKMKRLGKEGILTKRYVPAEKRTWQNREKVNEYTKNSNGSITFSAAEVEKALGSGGSRDTYTGYHKRAREESDRKKEASSIRGFLKMLRGEGFTNDELKELIAEVLIEAEGMKGLPKGWTQDSVKKFSKSLTGKEGTKEGFFKKCVAKMKGKMDKPEAFCASVKDELHGSTYWRGKDKTPQQAGKDVKSHQNVNRG